MIKINKNKCVGCGICEKVCPKRTELVDGIARIKDERSDCLKKAVIACPQKAIKDIKEELVFAIGTDDEKTIKQDDHVGMSKQFSIWKYSKGKLTFQETRDNARYKEDETRIHGDPNKAKATALALKGVDVLVGKMFGPNIVRLKNRFVCVVIRELQINKAIKIIEENIENIEKILEEKEKNEKSAIILN